MKNKLKKYAYHWFKSLDINQRMDINDQYTNETGYNTNIVSGLDNHSEEWMVMNYTDHIKDFIINAVAPD